jgi:hypothetical protein
MRLSRATPAAYTLIFVSCILSVLLHGCVTQQTQYAFNDGLDDAVQLHTGLTNTITAALNAKLISVEDAKRFRDLARTSREVLNAADLLAETDLSSAQGQLELAQAILIELEQYLLERSNQVR